MASMRSMGMGVGSMRSMEEGNKLHEIAGEGENMLHKINKEGGRTP